MPCEAKCFPKNTLPKNKTEVQSISPSLVSVDIWAGLAKCTMVAGNIAQVTQWNTF